MDFCADVFSGRFKKIDRSEMLDRPWVAKEGGGQIALRQRLAVNARAATAKEQKSTFVVYSTPLCSRDRN